MTLTVHDKIEQRSDEWYELRCGIATASAIGRLITWRTRTAAEFECPACGVPVEASCVSRAAGKTGTIKTFHPERAQAARESAPVLTVGDVDDLAWLLASERITGRCEDTFVTDAMWRGIDDEPRALAVYSEKYAPVTTVGFMVEDSFGFPIGYSPDGLVGEHGLAEVKSRAPKTQVRTVVQQDVPAASYAQLQCGLLVSGRDWIDYISYAGGMHMYVQRVLPDPEWFAVITDAATQLEHRVAQIVNTYNENSRGLTLTERVVEMEIVI